MDKRTPPRHRAQRPVFVDASGRRHRGLRAAGAIVVVPAVGYVSVLLSAVLGGPTIHSPFLPLPPPLPRAAAPQILPVPTAPSTTAPSKGAAGQPSAVDLASTQQRRASQRPIAILLTQSLLAEPPAPAGGRSTDLPKLVVATGEPPPLPTPAASEPLTALPPPSARTGRPTALPTPSAATARPTPASARGETHVLPTPPRRPVKP